MINKSERDCLEQETKRPCDTSVQDTHGISNSSPKPKYHDAVAGFSQLALGFSIVIALAIGVGIGLLLRKWLGYDWLLWLGVFWGVGAAVLNVYKAYKAQFNALEKLKDDPKYSYKKGNCAGE